MAKPSDAKYWAIFDVSLGFKAYLSYTAGNMYIDGSYYTFSPKLEEDVVSQLKREISKPNAERDEKGRVICPICNKPVDFCDKKEEHRKVIESNYAKDISLLALGSAKVVVDLCDEVLKLKEEINKLKASLRG
jgi:hypothetical protein